MTKTKDIKAASDEDVESMRKFAEDGIDSGWDLMAKFCHGYLTLIYRIDDLKAEKARGDGHE